MFDEMRYELNGVEIDRVRNPGVTTTLKGYASFNELNLRLMGNAGWAVNPSNLNSTTTVHSIGAEGDFSFCIPLSSLFGFAEDYKKMIVNARHELVLIRAPSDKNSVQWHPGPATGNPPVPDTNVESIKITLEKLCWRVPYVTLSDEQRVTLLFA